MPLNNIKEVMLFLSKLWNMLTEIGCSNKVLVIWWKLKKKKIGKMLENS